MIGPDPDMPGFRRGVLPRPPARDSANVAFGGFTFRNVFAPETSGFSGIHLHNFDFVGEKPAIAWRHRPADPLLAIRGADLDTLHKAAP